jgi:nucleoporin p58/p45
MGASQAAPSGGLFGSTSQSTQGGGLFGAASSQPAPSGGLFGATSQPPQGGGLFGGASSKPNQGLFSGSQAAQGTSFLGGSRQGGAVPPAGTLNLGQQSTLGTSSSSARIDLEHLRPTTKFDQLTEDLQREIVNLDTAILNEINRCNEVSNLLPTIEATGSNISNDVAYVTQKLEEVETGLENDAEEIQSLKENTVKKDANEAKVCFREVDRLKMPTQYQASVTGPAASVSGVYGGHGLSGWWNHPQTLQRTIRGGTGTGGSRSLQLPGDEDEDALAGAPANVVDLFDRRTEEMRKSLTENKSLLTEIEEFVISVENKIAAKQQEVMGREGRAQGIQGEEDQVGLLRYVFGEFERSLYEVADKVGGARDGVQELVLGRVGDAGRTDQKLAW